MTTPERRHRRWGLPTALVATACLVPALTGSAAGDGVTQLQNKLGKAQSQLNSNKHHEQSLTGSIAALNSKVSALASEISLVQSREAAARERLATYRTKLAATKVAIGRERRQLAHLHNILDRAVSALKAELVSQYEQPQQSVVSLFVDSTGFQQLLDGLQYLSRAKQREQFVITLTRRARAEAQIATDHLATLQHNDAAAASDASTQTDALAGMTALLNSRQAALADEQAAQSTALAASKAQGAKLQAAIATIQRQEAAAKQAVAQVILRGATSTGSTEVSGSGGISLAPSGGWAIPYPIVLCESGGQNLPPNSAGASGYYQIIPSTWRDFGGSGRAAYLAPKPEQDAVASRIWNNGAGAGNWTCAAIVGVT